MKKNNHYLFSVVPIFPIISGFKLSSEVSIFHWNPTDKTLNSTTNNITGEVRSPRLPIESYKTDHTSIFLQVRNWAALVNDIHLSDHLFIGQTITKRHCFHELAISSILTARWEALEITSSITAPSVRPLIWNNPGFSINKKPFISTD